MRRLTGQAALGIAMLLHWLGTVAITAAVLASVAVGAIAWRLAQGPFDLPWLTSRLEEAANARGGSARLSIQSAALTWAGFRLGVDSPLELRLTDVAITDAAGGSRVRVPQIEVSLSLHELMFGRIALRAVTLDSPQLRLLRAADGTTSVDLGSFGETTGNEAPAQPGRVTPVAELLANLAQPPGSDRDMGPASWFSQLSVVRIRDAHVTVIDRQLGATWQAPRATIELDRRPGGGVDGTADLSLAFGRQQARLNVSATLAPGASETRLRARLTGVTPSALAAVAPKLTGLAAVDAPVTIDASLVLDRNLALRRAQVSLLAGPGTVRINQTSLPILNAALVVAGTPDAIDVEAMRVTLSGRAGAPDTHLAVSGTVQRDPGRISAELSADLDQVDFADLPRLWPPGTGGQARDWILENITAGTAHNGHVAIGLAATPDLASLELTRASGTLDGEGLQVNWLRPAPPIENGRAQLRILDPDTLEIVVASGRQDLRGPRGFVTSGLQLRGGRMLITGIMQPHQIGAISADITGPVADAVTLLKEPRLRLLDRHPIDLRNPSGQAWVKLSLDVPLEKSVSMDDISVRAHAHLESVHLSAVADGHNLDQGVLDLDANADGLKVSGRALLASIPVRLDTAMDFRAGPPNQVLQTVTVASQTDAKELAAAGLDATPIVSGPLDVHATLTERRNGQGELAVSADLRRAELTVEPLGWRKERNATANASARLTLEHDRLTGIDRIEADGSGLALRGGCDLRDGQITQVRVDRLVLGRTMARGTVRLPAGSARAPIAVSLDGTEVDLSRFLAHPAPKRTPSRGQEEPSQGPAWTLDARFDRVLMSNDRALTAVALHAENDGRVMHRLRIEGHTGSRAAPFLAQIVPVAGGRRLTASAGDAGDLLSGLDVVRDMQGGTLSVQASYDDAAPGRPLAGTAKLDDFRIRNAPVLARLLQAMTLYGLVEVMQGPGLGFTHLIAPFRLTDDALVLADARAFSPSLGLTVKGRIDRAMQQLDLQGTIVPAYFFNALLGNIPLVGKLFSPERGGGVFAASYTVRGPVDDPSVFVNPLTALTPGFLRGLFGMF